MRYLSALVIVLGLLLPAIGHSQTATNPVVIIETSKGNITVELYADKAPITVENFLGYVRSGFYNGTIFHRVIRRFAVQGGGFTPDLVEKDNGEPIINESKTSKLSNERWTIAMARTNDPNSAQSQFYFNMGMNLNLDARMGRDGYAVFGKVIDGQNVVRDIAVSRTHSVGGFDDVPVEPILITNTSIKQASGVQQP
ncbi:cyclophilin type peptidyl-prolyl cis-trans isomerase [gamma proteobacterium BDW918]|uniref:Peptidyl-prolyl cis-trans isomerase n=1 Tax=Zhongshania aliphaticivorans TaxID=1470434 RepID=A0A127M5Z9_9GAMM|nr:peptidylprolyl isomerase [Zhongshania aliphaticivorans]AMO68617.1 peptidylprolyl isomerase [Zhongshania aliphaticivorans]EIF43145.1 cyclophilin type peptidyl-prolyl cis-trans isomerase [gamma proteobacterium BDW918]